ncbi:MAG: hypothetical protein HXX09_07505 [Bacteroidetes bacterium]|nr:hypothetical protein [Bacteroidota bacterium]
MKSRKIKIFLIILFLIGCSFGAFCIVYKLAFTNQADCSLAPNNNRFKNLLSKIPAEELLKAIDPDDSLLEVKRKMLIGKIIPNTDDSTLLNLFYGSCFLAGDKYEFNWGPQIWDQSDSVYMKVEQRLGDDTTQIIYIRGEMAITCVMHNFFNESAIILEKVENGWKIKDCYIDMQLIDYESIEIAGKFDNHFLLRYETAGIYAGGVGFGDVQYTLMPRNSFEGPSITFILSSSNGATDRCEQYSKDGKVDYVFNKKMNCLIFDYKFKRYSVNCDNTIQTNDSIYQRWYMNADTSFLGKGKPIADFGDEIGENVNLSKSEIYKRLQTKK